MNKFIFQFPAKIVFAESNISLRKIECQYPLYAIDGRKAFFNTKKEKISITKIDNLNSYYLLIDGRLVYVSVGDDFSTIERLNGLGVEFIDSYFAKVRNYIQHPEVYEQEQSAIREKIRQEREARDTEQKEQDERRKLAAETRYKESLEKYKRGEKIEWETFERACSEFGVNIPIKTKGWGRKCVTQIGVDGYSFRGNPSGTIGRFSQELRDKMS